jgi:hypothetical protein
MTLNSEISLDIEALMMAQEELRRYDPKTTITVEQIVEKTGNQEKSIVWKSTKKGTWELITPVKIITKKLYGT